MYTNYLKLVHVQGQGQSYKIRAKLIKDVFPKNIHAKIVFLIT